MKFMNNHYGQFPMKLQLFAESEGDGDGGNDAADEGGADGDHSDGNQTPTVEELLTQLSEARAESAKLKLANDKASKEAAGYKKQLQAKMSAEERASEAENERITALEEENRQMKAQMRVSGYSKRYIGIGMDEKTADSMAELTGDLEDVDKFFSTLEKFVQAKVKASGEERLQRFLKDRPDIKAGSGENRESLAVEKAKQLAVDNHFGAVNADALKRFM